MLRVENEALNRPSCEKVALRYAGRLTDAFEERLAHGVAPRGILDRRSKVDAREQQAVHVQAEIDALHVVGGARQQARADEERQRQRELHADEHAPGAAARPRADRAAALFLEGARRVGGRRLPRGQDPEEQRGGERAAGEEDGNRRVEIERQREL